MGRKKEKKEKKKKERKKKKKEMRLTDGQESTKKGPLKRGSKEFRAVVKMLVVPLLSDLTTTVILADGRLAFGLSLTIKG